MHDRDIDCTIPSETLTRRSRKPFLQYHARNTAGSRHEKERRRSWPAYVAGSYLGHSLLRLVR